MRVVCIDANKLLLAQADFSYFRTRSGLDSTLIASLRTNEEAERMIEEGRFCGSATICPSWLLRYDI